MYTDTLYVQSLSEFYLIYFLFLHEKWYFFRGKVIHLHFNKNGSRKHQVLKLKENLYIVYL